MSETYKMLNLPPSSESEQTDQAHFRAMPHHPDGVKAKLCLSSSDDAVVRDHFVPSLRKLRAKGGTKTSSDEQP